MLGRLRRSSLSCMNAEDDHRTGYGDAAPSADSRPFWIFWWATSTSGLGTAISSIAFQLVAVSTLDATAFELALVAIGSQIGWVVLGLPAGPIVARFRLRDVQIAADLVRSAAILSIPAAWLTGSLTLTQMVVVSVVISLGDVLFETANASFLPRVVDRDMLMARNSLISGTTSVVDIGGRSLAGVLVQVIGAALALAFDAVSYVLSAILLSRMPRSAETDARRRDSILAAVRAGWQWVRREPIVWRSTWCSTLINLYAGAQFALLILFLTDERSVPPAWMGVLLSVNAVAALVGAISAPKLGRTQGVGRTTLLASMSCAIGALILPLGSGAGGIGLYVFGTFTYAASVVVITTATRTYRQSVVPQDMLPSVSATVRFISWSAIPVGSLVAGVLATAFGTQFALICVALVVTAVPILFATGNVSRFDEQINLR